MNLQDYIPRSSTIVLLCIYKQKKTYFVKLSLYTKYPRTVIENNSVLTLKAQALKHRKEFHRLLL